MTFEIKNPTPRTDTEVRRIERDEERVSDRRDCYIKLARKLERELIACGHEQLRCAGCGAGRNDSAALTGEIYRTKLETGKFTCPLCGHDNSWKRVARFVTI